jgi:hypothetical protein
VELAYLSERVLIDGEKCLLMLLLGEEAQRVIDVPQMLNVDGDLGLKVASPQK